MAERLVPAGMSPQAGVALVLDLEEVRPSDRLRVGGKAANLASLVSADFRVPSGVVLTTAAFESYVEANGLDSALDPELVASAFLPDGVRAVIDDIGAAFGETPLAVRSSSVTEDLAEASFAGQYETVLNVEPGPQLEGAVLRCWAAAFAAHLDGYRQARGMGNAPLALLIQPMVDALAAGVAFTANPVSGRRDEIVVDAVTGLGERLVSGAASPDEWVVRGKETDRIASPEGAIDREQVLAIAELGRRVEEHFGRPQDVEWAIGRDGRVHVLQARPITSLPDPPVEPIPVEFEVRPGFWMRDPSHNPRAGYHIDTLFFPLIVSTSRRQAEEFGYLFEGIEFDEFGLWPYMRMVPLGGEERRPPPRWVMWLGARLFPTLRGRVAAAKSAVRSGKADRFVERWYETWHPELAGAISTYLDVDLESLTDADLHEHIDSASDLLERGIEVHSLLTASLAIVLYELAKTCEQALGWDLVRCLELVSGTSYKSTEPARRLNELARAAASRPAVRAAISDPEVTFDQLKAIDRRFGKDLAAYLHQYGARALGYTVAEPTLAEMPEVFLGMIRGQLEYAYDPRRLEDEAAAARREASAEALRRLGTADGGEFRSLLDRATRAYPVREDNEFFTISAPIALMRYAILELGRRLVARGVIERRDDVRFVELDRARSALAEHESLHELVSLRKGQRAWAEMNPGPDFYGDPPPGPPTFDFLPVDARRPMEALLWSYEEMMALGFTADDGIDSTLRGIAASPGQYTGPARVVMDEADFEKLQPGDVLVCPITSPVWSVLFSIVGALVTDVGGILSHPAIIAREYQVPAVVATGEATSRFQDGQLVTVDGTAGTIVEVR